MTTKKRAKPEHLQKLTSLFATADRVRELTGMHPDDIADAVQCMVDHGQLIGREVYFATVYEVAA